jgi:hypothetical protein
MMIRVQLLRELERCRGFLLPEPTLFAAVEMAMAPRPTSSEIGSELKECERKGLVSGATNDLTGVRRWRITDMGRTVLQEIGG